MSHSYPYVSDQYKHLLSNQQQPSNPIIYHPNYQQYNNQIPSQQYSNYQPPIQYSYQNNLPQNQSYTNNQQNQQYIINQQNQLYKSIPQNQLYTNNQQNQLYTNNQQNQQYIFNQQHSINQQYPNNYGQRLGFLPGNNNSQNGKANQRFNHDSFAADQPSSRFQSSNQYPDLEVTKQTPGTPYDKSQQTIHKVQYGDTLQGLSLIYDVPINKIKQRNNIDGDSIYYLKQIIIPNPKASPLQMARTQQFFIQQFMTYMPLSQKSQKVAKYYLEQNQWNVDAAVKAFKEDLQWEKNNKVQIKSIPINKNQKFSLDYSQQELLLKKYQ